MKHFWFFIYIDVWTISFAVESEAQEIIDVLRVWSRNYWVHVSGKILLISFFYVISVSGHFHESANGFEVNYVRRLGKFTHVESLICLKVKKKNKQINNISTASCDSSISLGKPMSINFCISQSVFQRYQDVYSKKILLFLFLLCYFWLRKLSQWFSDPPVFFYLFDYYVYNISKKIKKSLPW